MSDNAARYTAEYMANEYRNEASGWTYKYEELKEDVKKLISLMPTDRILWVPDIKEQVTKIEKHIGEQND